MLRRKRFWFGLIISLSFLGVFLARTDFEEIRRSFGEANYWLAFAAVPLYFVGFWLRTIRWHLLLKPVINVSVRRLYPIVLIGLMANNVAPARVGELVRAYLVGERESISKSTALGTIAGDWAFDGLTLVALLGIVAAISGATAGVKLIGVLTALLFAAMTVVLVVLAFSPRARHVVSRLITLLPRGLALRIEGMLDAFLSGLIAVRSPLTLAMAMALSFISWLVEGFMYWVVGQAFGLDVGFDAYLLILAAANLALSILASPGGVGPFEAASQQVLHSFAVAQGLAGAYTLALHALLLGPVIIVGFVLLWSTQVSLSQILGVPRQPSAVPARTE